MKRIVLATIIALAAAAAGLTAFGVLPVFSQPPGSKPADSAVQVVLDLRGASSDKCPALLDKAVQDLKSLQEDDAAQIPLKARTAASADPNVVKLMQEAERMEGSLKALTATSRPEPPAERGEFETKLDYDKRLAEYDRKKKEYDEVIPKASQLAEQIKRQWELARRQYDSVYDATVKKLQAERPVKSFRILMDAEIGKFDIDNMLFNITPAGFYYKPGTMKTREATPEQRVSVGSSNEVVTRYMEPDQPGISVDPDKGLEAKLRSTRVEVTGFNGVDQAKNFKQACTGGQVWLVMTVQTQDNPEITLRRMPGRIGREGWRYGLTPFKEDGSPVMQVYRIELPPDAQFQFSLATSAAGNYANLKYLTVENKELAGFIAKQETPAGRTDDRTRFETQAILMLLRAGETSEPAEKQRIYAEVVRLFPDSAAAKVAREKLAQSGAK
ncbi:MAG: hypothetical protein HZA50_12200 [Planctomycetes bacterium]|nr:hypothetical protein [Planctomycetota bacterium]